VYRIRVRADRDLTDLLHRLTEHDVQVLEIRRWSPPSRPSRPAEQACPQELEDLPAPGTGVVVPFPVRTRPSPSGAGPALRCRSSRVAVFDPGDDGSAG
jgi:hypothetical protein